MARPLALNSLAPTYLTIDSAGNLYIADSGNNRIRKVSSSSKAITTVAGDGAIAFSGDNGPATSAGLSAAGIAVDSAGNLYIADHSNSRIRKVSGGVIATTVGNGTGGDNGPAAAASADEPFGLDVDSAGNLYIGEVGTSRIRKVSSGVITTVAGNGPGGFSGDNGPSTSAQLAEPSATAVDSAGSLYIADRLNNRIRRVSGGTITTVAGNGTFGFSGDNGPAVNAELGAPSGVAVDPAGNVYIADADNSRIRRISNGTITTVAGNGTFGFSGDNGPAVSAELNQPSAVAVDATANLYIVDGFRIRKVSNGIITTIAGNGTIGFSGDNGPATGAELNDPTGVAVDSAGDIYIAEFLDNRIRKVSNGIITTIAGNGTPIDTGDNGPAINAQLAVPSGVSADSSGNLYIAETTGNHIRKVANGIITTIAGNGTYGFSGDGGPAAIAQLDSPQGVAIDSVGNVFVADTRNNRIRLLQLPPAINPGGILNAASSAVGHPVAPGSIATVYGSFLVSSLSTAGSAPLPTNLGGLSLQFGGSLSAPLFAVSGGQVNFQVPWELGGQSQTALSAAINGQTSATQTLNLAAYTPGIFSINAQGSGQGAILDSLYNLVSSSNPATAGITVLQIYCTGLGPVNNQPPSGSAASNAELSQTIATPTVTIGGVTATVLFSGLAPGSVGEYQVDALVPAASSKGAAVPVAISIGGATSNTVTIAVQ